MGWIKIDRQIFDSWLWKQKKPFDQRSAWIDLLLLANYEDTKKIYKGKVILCKRGDVNLSYTFLAERWGWSRGKVVRFLELLKSDGMLTEKRTENGTAITVINYGKFQDVRTENGQQTDSKRTEDGRQADTTKNIKNIKNIKKYMPTSKFSEFETHEYDFEELEKDLLGEG